MIILNTLIEIDILEACTYGHLDILKKIIDSALFITPMALDSGFTRACIYGHFDIVKYLINLYKISKSSYINYPIININSEFVRGFIWACNNGKLNIVKYLITLHKQNSNYEMINSYNINQGFKIACDYGHTNIIKYLIKLYKIRQPNNKLNYCMICINTIELNIRCINTFAHIKYLLSCGLNISERYKCVVFL
jgi:hypothetical protein